MRFVFFAKCHYFYRQMTKMTQSITKIFGTKKLNSRIDLIVLSRVGISMKMLKGILQFTSLTIKEVATLLPVSERQLSRYEDAHLLRKDISSHLILLVELYERGFEVLGEQKFKAWTKLNNRALGGLKPIEILDTSIGINMVRDILGRIEHGIHS